MNKKRILWIDDDSKGMLSVFGLRLKRQGFELESVVSLDSAIYLLQIKSFDIVITDMIFPAGLKMIPIPGVYLINAIRNGEIKKDIANIPIIILSVAGKENIQGQLNSNNLIYYFSSTDIGDKEIFTDIVKIIEKS